LHEIEREREEKKVVLTYVFRTHLRGFLGIPLSRSI